MRKKSAPKSLLMLLFAFLSLQVCIGQQPSAATNFAVRGFHLDLRIQVMTMPALKNFALRLSQSGINTLIMEYEATYPFEKHPMIPNRYAYTKKEIEDFVAYCGHLGIDVVPLQQSFGHVDYILRNNRYAALREDEKDWSQVCPSQVAGDSALFTDLFTELAATHPSKYFHIGGDETHLLGHCPLCKKKAAEEGISRLYIDHIKMLCAIVIKLGKRPVLWADIALKYPDAIKLLPKETIFVDWNYGWDMNNFGNHEKLVQSGYEIWGAPSLRSHPDNYFLTQWEKHFNNIRTFVPACRQLGYKGMVMTSWSTSGEYSTIYESESGIIDLYAIRRVYPLTGFNMLLAAYAKSLQSTAPLDIDAFVQSYCMKNYGFDKAQAQKFWVALKTAPYEIKNGTVSGAGISVTQLLDSALLSEKTINALTPVRNSTEYEQYKVMASARVLYLTYQNIENQANSNSFTAADVALVLPRLRKLLAATDKLNDRFTRLNQSYYYPSEIAEENRLRKVKATLLYNRLTRTK